MPLDPTKETITIGVSLNIVELFPSYGKWPKLVTGFKP